MKKLQTYSVNPSKKDHKFQSHTKKLPSFKVAANNYREAEELAYNWMKSKYPRSTIDVKLERIGEIIAG